MCGIFGAVMGNVHTAAGEGVTPLTLTELGSVIDSGTVILMQQAPTAGPAIAVNSE
jgi:hypothetical protein